jgi:CheY-like chemotaxis protein
MRRPNDLRTSTSAVAVLDPPSCPLHRILVVDDDRRMRQLNSEVLLQSGYLVDTAENGAVAWDTLSAQRYDLLVTDHSMPKLTGVELLRKLHAASMAVPAILATGNLPKAELKLYPWIKPAATLLKPYTIAQLVGTVKQVLGAAGGGKSSIEASF